MPTTEEILNGLSLAANKYFLFSIFWHIIVLIFLVLLFAGKKISSKFIMIGIIALFLSVSIITTLVHNPFNAVIFFLASLQFGYMALRYVHGKFGVRWDYISAAGLIMLVFGFVYPHFMENASFFKYLCASPLGLIPCPTLSAIVGITLLFHGFNSRRWMLWAAFIGLFYGVFGVLRLKVYLDTGLIAGALFLLIYAFSVKSYFSPDAQSESADDSKK